MSSDKIATLVFLRRENEILLTMKKRGFGKGKWNGPGGKVEGETIEDGAKREVKEEINVDIIDMDKVAYLTFYDSGEKLWSVHVYICWNFEGIPIEGEEVNPSWFSIDEIPYDKMWEDDQYWLPKILNKEKITGNFYFSKGMEKLEKFDMKELKLMESKKPRNSAICGKPKYKELPLKEKRRIVEDIAHKLTFGKNGDGCWGCGKLTKNDSGICGTCLAKHKGASN